MFIGSDQNSADKTTFIDNKMHKTISILFFSGFRRKSIIGSNKNNVLPTRYK
jgi:hypothetical protein